MAHIREMIIESNKTLEDSGSYHKAGRSMTITFRPDEYPLTGPPEGDGDWTPMIMDLGKQLDNQVDIALGLKTQKPPETREEEKPEPKQEKFHIKDPESPMTPGQKEGIEKLMNIPGAPKLINTYRATHDIKGGWDTANKGQADDIMKLLIQLGKEKKGGD